MAKKKGRARKKRKYNKGKRNFRVVFVTLGFLALVFSSIYLLDHLRDQLEGGGDIQTKDTDRSGEIIRNVEDGINSALFNLGFSKHDIKKETRRQSRGYREITVVDGSGLLKSESSRKQLLSSVSGESSEGVLKKSARGYVLDIEIDGNHTHRYSFIFPADAPRITSKQSAGKPGSDKKAVEPDVSAKKEIFAHKKPKIAIIVDDLGMDKYYVDRFAEISPDLTFAVLPNLPNSNYAADVAKSKGIDLLLHLPMEPKTVSGYNADDAGEGVLFVGQTKENILKSLESNLNAMPYAKGVNNHMGSKFTENRELMELVLRDLKDRGLFFVDSFTTAHSQGYQVAREIGMQTAKRDYFLDDRKKGKEYVAEQLRKLVEKSEKEGVAIGICHPYPQTVEVFTKELPSLSKRVDIVPVSEILN